MRLIVATILLFVSLVAGAGETAVLKLYSETKERTWFATAFFISDNRMMTAAHTFEHTVKSGKHSVLIDGKKVPAKIIMVDFDKDMCILETDPLGKGFYEMNPVGAPKGVPATHLGFDWRKKEMGRLEYRVKKTKNGKVETDGGVPGGFSGGPTVGYDGKVIGMCIKGDGSKTYSISADVLAAFVKEARK